MSPKSTIYNKICPNCGKPTDGRRRKFCSRSCGHLKHGGINLPEYQAWKSMKRRCLNPTCQVYAYYGGRGITVCERWLKWENFYTDMGPRPSAKHTLDRIENNGNYEPGNCRWATMKVQYGNKRMARDDHGRFKIG